MDAGRRGLVAGGEQDRRDSAEVRGVVEVLRDLRRGSRGRLRCRRRRWPYLAEQLKLDPELFTGYDWTSRTIKYHREQVRAAFGFREFTRGDEDKLAGWLAEEVCPVELRDEQLREALLVRCRTERIEPPGRLDRIIGSARTAFEKRFCELTCSWLDQECADRLEVLLVDESGSGRGGLLAELKADPG